jgi:hypothetical protein
VFLSEVKKMGNKTATDCEIHGNVERKARTTMNSFESFKVSKKDISGSYNRLTGAKAG